MCRWAFADGTKRMAFALVSRSLYEYLTLRMVELVWQSCGGKWRFTWNLCAGNKRRNRHWFRPATLFLSNKRVCARPKLEDPVYVSQRASASRPAKCHLGMVLTSAPSPLCIWTALIFPDCLNLWLSTLSANIFQTELFGAALCTAKLMLQCWVLVQ